MKKMIWKLPFIGAMMLTFALLFSTNANAQKLPYWYEFKADTEDFNGLIGFKQKKLIVTFDVPPTITPANLEFIKVYQGNTKLEGLIDYGSTGVVGTELTIEFENLKLLDLTNKTKLDYKVVIPPAVNAIAGQSTNIELPFKTYELLSGFGDIFLDNGNTTQINKIFETAAPRDINISVPNAYFTSIQTIHRLQGIDNQDPENPNTSPILTNIDVITASEVSRVAVIGEAPNASAENDRDLYYRADIKGFSMGQAGIDALNCADNPVECKNPGDTDLTLVAYDAFGKKLTEYTFRIKVKDETKDYFVNDYLPKPDKVFGTTITLYDLMKDTKTFDAITKRMGVDKFHQLGITFPLGDKASVKNYDELILALANPTIKNITIDPGPPIPHNVTINRDVTIDGGDFSGNVMIDGGGKDVFVRLNNATIDGTKLNVAAGTNGEVTLYNTTYNPSLTPNSIPAPTSGKIAMFATTDSDLDAALEQDNVQKIILAGTTLTATNGITRNVIIQGGTITLPNDEIKGLNIQVVFDSVNIIPTATPLKIDVGTKGSVTFINSKIDGDTPTDSSATPNITKITGVLTIQ